MTLEEYKSELSDSLYFGPWNECNPQKALLLVKTAEAELSDPDLAEVYASFVFYCFDSSVKFGDETKEYYDNAIKVFDKLTSLVNRQETNDIFDKASELVEETIECASQATGWASGYDWYLKEEWEKCRWDEDD